MESIQNEADVGGLLRQHGAWLGVGGALSIVVLCAGLLYSGEVRVDWITGAGSAENAEIIGRDQFGERWPFTVENGTLRCDDGAITFTPDDTTYAVNGLAKSRGLGEAITPIWRDSPKGYRVKYDIAPIIEAGQKLCD